MCITTRYTAGGAVMDNTKSNYIWELPHRMLSTILGWLSVMVGKQLLPDLTKQYGYYP